MTRLAELTPSEAAELGPVLAAASAALEEVVGCEKTYVALFAEAEGFAHVHFHLVPRMPGFGDHDVGPRVFHFLGRPEEEQVPVSDADRLATDLALAIARHLA